MFDLRKVTSERAKTKHLLAVKRIHLSNKIYNTLQMLKYQRPYKSDSDFDTYLISLEMRRRERQEPKVSTTISFVLDL